MDKLCGIHKKPMKLNKRGYYCPTPTSKNPDGSVATWCSYKPQEEQSTETPKTTEIPQNQTDTDWDAIARGKVRSLLVQAVLQHRGLEPITEGDIKALEGWVNYCMDGANTEDMAEDLPF